MPERTTRINEVIKQELGQAILREVELPADSFLTISGVRVSKDLGYAKIFIKIIPVDEQKNILNILKRAIPGLRRILAKKISLYHFPRLEFIIDQTAERAERINQLLDEINQEL